MRHLESQLQAVLEAVYRLERNFEVADFRIDAEVMQFALPQDGTPTREALLVHVEDDETHLALFIADEIRHRAATFFSKCTPSEEHLDAALVATEGVSHFVYFTFCGEQQERPVSQIELELQAEIDKYLVLRLACGLGGPALIEALFDRFELDAGLSPEAQERYQVANRAGRRYARWLDRALSTGDAPRALEDARRLYRKSLPAKLEHIDRRAA